ncbi:Serine/threonine-protein phosphatase 4 regulatory subunit 3-like central domain-containing protein [Entamoeba marina]
MIHSHWKVAGDSNITLLLRSNPSLEQVLEQPDLLPELRVNTELQTFMCTQVSIKKMVSYVCGNSGVKHQVLAGAVLSSGIGCVVDAVFSDDTIALFMLKQLTSTEKRLAGLTLDLLCKVLSSLLIPVQSREFTLVKSTNGFLDGLIRYLESYSVCDYIIALLKLDVFHQNSGSIQWFCEHGFITMLLNVFLEENISLEKVESVSRIINEIVIWRHSHQIGAAANIFVDFFNVDKNLEKFIQCVFSTDLKDVQEHGLLIISDMLACNTSRSELCTMPINGLPAIYKNLVIHFSSIKELLTHSNSNIGVGQTRIKLGFIVLSLLLSSYSVIYKLVDEHAFINALLDIFYDERHQCTIFRQIVLNIMNTIMQRPVAEIKGKILQDNTFLERTVKLDKDAIAYYKQNNIYPDYFLINATMMNDIYNNKELKTTTTEITINNETFLNYVQNIIIPRNSEESKYFSKTHVPDNYFDNNTYTNFLLNAKQLIDDDDMF